MVLVILNTPWRRGLARGDVALVIEHDGDGLAVLHGLALPDAGVGLGKIGDIGEAGLGDAALGLAFGEAAMPLGGCRDLVDVAVLDGGVMRTGLAILRERAGADGGGKRRHDDEL